MVKNIIETFNLSKVYFIKGKGKGNVVNALEDINLSIKAGEKFGLLGANSAGKTTMIKILATLIRPTNGFAKIDGYNILKNPKIVRNRIALMISDQMLYTRITGYSNLKFFCKMYNIHSYDTRIKELVKEFEIEKWIYQYVDEYSRGTKIKLALCRTLLLNRKILFLDEPISGLDIKTRVFIIEKLRNLDKTIFLTSHDLGVIESICNRIAFLSKGKIIKIVNQEEIKKIEKMDIILEIEIPNNTSKLKEELKQLGFVKSVANTRNGLNISLIGRENYNNLLNVLVKYRIYKIKEKETTLEDFFLKII